MRSVHKSSVCLLMIVIVLLLIKFNLFHVIETSHLPITHTRVNTNVPLKKTTIPKRIHQIWNDEVVPNVYVDNVKGLVKDNPPPVWEYYFWTTASGLKFLQEKYPYLHERVMAGADHLVRADILRYAIIHEYGGMYFDLDTVSVQPLDNFVASHECSLSLEPGEHYFQHKTDLLLTNSVLMCVPQHSFFKNILLLMSKLPRSCKIAFTCTGPLALSGLYRSLNLDNGSLFEVPDIQASEVFQDLYDVGYQGQRVKNTCSNYTKLQHHEVVICDKWKKRGYDKRSLSIEALTYHTWHHALRKKLDTQDKNNIKTLIPNVKIYGQTFS